MKISSVSNNISVNPSISKHVAPAIESADTNVYVESESGAGNDSPPIGVGKDTSTKDTIGEAEQEILSKSIEQANKTLKIYDRKLELSVHEVTHTVMYKLKDTRTNEVIMEFPPKKIQDMIAKMWELAGLFVDEKA